LGSNNLDSSGMRHKTIDLTLLKKAQQGHKENLSILSELARQDIFAYLYRLTLDVHAAEDLCQETMLQMLKSLPHLRIISVMSFWAWLYKTAFSKVSHQFRNQGKTRIQKRTFSDNDFMKQVPANGKSVSDDLIRKELTTAIYEAMNSIKIKYRNILALRCFQNLSYNEIALVTGGSELQARLLFYRAKRSLRHQLATRGFRQKGQLLSALSLFAALTAGSSKSASATTVVSTASLNVSAGIAALDLATTKTGVISIIVAATCITIGVINRDALIGGVNEPVPVRRRLKNENPNLLNLLQNPDFHRPSSIGKSNDPNGNGFFWTDRSQKRPSEPHTDIRELLIRRSEQDLHAVILSDARWIDFRFQNPIINGPGADIIIAGWSDPPPVLEVFGAQNSPFRLTKFTRLDDTWGRCLFGYDLSQVPNLVGPQIVRLIGTHNQGPHHGFELNDIRAKEH
jgi:RNA polymerase sigma-70 factor (ECF subfamily)